MEWQRIQKRPGDYVGANLLDYDECARTILLGAGAGVARRPAGWRA